jgi:phosphoribosylaminoimidazolecarboxamide formyltransferase/IMP cyclohydrolase
MIEIRTALISVYKKEGIVELAEELKKHNVEILSTGGTARLLKENGIEVTEVSDYTGFPEMLAGRVKTLHPKIHAGLLARRDNLEDMEKLKELGIKPIDMVVVNLYPFEEVIKKEGATLEEAIEFIDIGGPTMLRSAAKNYRHVAVVSSPNQYKRIIEELKKYGGISEDLSFQLAREVFYLTAHYNSVIANYLESVWKGEEFPGKLILVLDKVQDLRYGENPHQKAGLYRDPLWEENFNLVSARQLHGKELSFNNWLDLDAALSCVMEFDKPAASVIKHNNPCGMACGKNLREAFLRAYQCDPLSAFGSIIGLNREVDELTAEALLTADFLECIIAPDYEEKALEMLKRKKNLRIMRLNPFPESAKLEGYDFKRIKGGFLAQDWDSSDINKEDLKIVTKKAPTDEEIETLLFAWKAVKNVKSNAIVLAKQFEDGVYATVGIGAGQMSRVDSVIIACRKAGDRAKGSVLASDAFFPKPDSIEVAHQNGITSIIQPGGSIRDEEVIKKADELGLAMVFTGQRHFRH